jgi:hypothetical protein
MTTTKFEKEFWKGTQRARLALSKGLQAYIENEQNLAQRRSDPRDRDKPVWISHLAPGFGELYALALLHFMPQDWDAHDLKEILAMALQAACEVGERVIDQERPSTNTTQPK